MTLQRIAATLAIVLTTSACGAHISAGGESLTGAGDDSGATDGAGGGDGGIGGTPIGLDAGTPLDAPAAATCNARVLYLNFDGQALTTGNTSDATQNIASWADADGAAPKFRRNDNDRDAEIKAIVDGVTTQLSQFPITVSTTRPATGQYSMVVLGGNNLNVHTRFGDAASTLDCGDLAPNDVAWINENLSPQHTINLVIGAVEFGLGLPGTDDPNDCLCGWANNCASNDDAPCTLSAAIAPSADDNPTCPVGATENEIGTIHDAFCGKPTTP